MIFEGMEIPEKVYEAIEKLRQVCYEAAEALKNLIRDIFTDNFYEELQKIAEEYSAMLRCSPCEKRLRPDYKANLLAGTRWRTYECYLRKERRPYMRRYI